MDEIDPDENKTLDELISGMHGEDGWWKSGAEDAYKRLGKELMDRGFTKWEALDLLQSAYSAAAYCFGR